jgi:hypothetical protein
VVPETVAVPRKVLRSKMRTVSPGARAAESVPLMARELSSVVLPESMVPVKMPTLSVMAVTAAGLAGAVVSTVAV